MDLIHAKSLKGTVVVVLAVKSHGQFHGQEKQPVPNHLLRKDSYQIHKIFACYLHRLFVS